MSPDHLCQSKFKKIPVPRWPVLHGKPSSQGDHQDYLLNESGPRTPGSRGDGREEPEAQAKPLDVHGGQTCGGMSSHPEGPASLLPPHSSYDLERTKMDVLAKKFILEFHKNTNIWEEKVNRGRAAFAGFLGPK